MCQFGNRHKVVGKYGGEVFAQHQKVTVALAILLVKLSAYIQKPPIRTTSRY